MRFIRLLRQQSGAGLVEAALIMLLVALVAVTSVTALKVKFEVATWNIGIWLINPVTHIPGGPSTLEVWVPASVFRYYGGPDISPHAWAKVRRVTCAQCDAVSELQSAIITGSDIIAYGDRPTD